MNKASLSKSTNYQLARGHELNFKNGVAYDETSKTYQVKSISKSGSIHIVSKVGKKLECDCLGYKYNKNCSHSVAVRIFQRSGSK